MHHVPSLMTDYLHTVGALPGVFGSAIPRFVTVFRDPLPCHIPTRQNNSATNVWVIHVHLSYNRYTLECNGTLRSLAQ